MSVRLMTRVFQLPIPTTNKFVLLAMADHARDDGTNCYPAVGTLQKKTSLSERAVQQCIHDLEAAHYVKTVGTIHVKTRRRGSVGTKKRQDLDFGHGVTTEYAITLAKGEQPLLLQAKQQRLEADRERRRRRNPARRAPLSPHDVTGNPARRAARTPHVAVTEPRTTCTRSRVLSGDLSKIGDGRANIDHRQDAKTSSATTDDDNSRALPPSETSQQTAAEQYNKRVDEYREKVLPKFGGRADEEFLNAALDLIDQRAWDKKTRIGSAQYFVTALENFLNDQTAVADLKQELLRAKARRDRFNIPDGLSEKDHNAEKHGQYVECVRFAVEESERTGRPANEILAEVLAARGIAS